jgi:hypothetical protein
MTLKLIPVYAKDGHFKGYLSEERADIKGLTLKSTYMTTGNKTKDNRRRKKKVLYYQL